MNLRFVPTPNKWLGGNRCEVIIIHWWDRPEKRPTLAGVVGHLTNPASKVSAHYVVSDDQVVQLAVEADRTWHALQANSFAIGIEVDPNTPGRTYETVAALVADIRKRRGNLPLKRHKDYVDTTCPGNIDLGKIEQLANGGGASMYQEELINEGDDKNLAVGLALRFDGLPLNWAKGRGWKKAFYDITASEEYRRNIASIQRAMELVGAKSVSELAEKTKTALAGADPQAAAKLKKIKEIVG